MVKMSDNGGRRLTAGWPRWAITPAEIRPAPMIATCGGTTTRLANRTSDHLIGVEGDDLILIGKMGVWEATTHVSQSDVVKLFWLLLRSLPVWAYLLRLPLTVNRKAKISNN